MSRKVLITGSSGFIGGQLVERFRFASWKTIGLSRRANSKTTDIVRDLQQPLPSSLNANYDVVIHAAARSNPWGTRSQYDNDNVQGTQHVLEFCQRNGHPKLVYLSSSSVYYRNEHQWNLNEDSPLADQFVNQYASTKREGELLVEQYPGPWSILRPRAVFGPGDTVLLPRILRAAQQGRLPLLTTSDGPVIGDLIYITNLVDCIENVAETPEILGTFNLTNDAPVPIHDFLFDVFDQLKIPRPRRKVSATTAMRLAGGLELFHRLFLPSVEPAITRFGVHVFRYSKTFDVSRMKSIFGSPKIDLETAKRLTVEWFRQSAS